MNLVSDSRPAPVSIPSGLLIASLRRPVALGVVWIKPPEPSGQPHDWDSCAALISRLHYFEPIIELAQQLAPSDYYRWYLCDKLKQLASGWCQATASNRPSSHLDALSGRYRRHPTLAPLGFDS
jgi:hypothetical protein